LFEQEKLQAEKKRKQAEEEEKKRKEAEVEEKQEKLPREWQVLAELRDHTGFVNWRKHKDGWGTLEEHRDSSQCAGVTVESGKITKIELLSSNLAGE
jgi:hypothetical protein